MSPNVGNFVHDLVEMAKAMETLPQVQAELERTKSELDNALESIQSRELAIIDYKNDIAILNDRIRSLEVERDDASFRVLEAEDREHVVLNMARSIASAVGNVINTLDPPKPEPVKEPEPQSVPTSEGQSAMNPTSSPIGSSKDTLGGNSVSEAVHSVEEVPQGQSESSPTAKEESISSETASSQSASTNVSADTTAGSVDPGPAIGPYFGKRYHEHPAYVPLFQWIEGGGSEEDYFWHPHGYGSTF